MAEVGLGSIILERRVYYLRYVWLQHSMHGISADATGDALA